MKRPGFRRSGGGDERAEPQLPGIERAPFSQAQILHLMKTEFSRARRHGYPLACMCIRIDRLGKLAEIHGASLRDDARRELGRLIVQRTREYDHAGLVHGDGYLVVLPHADAAEAEVVARRIHDDFSNLRVEVGGQQLPLSLSIGIAACHDRDTLFFDTLVSQAELAVERLEQRGGDAILTFQRTSGTLGGS